MKDGKYRGTNSHYFNLINGLIKPDDIKNAKDIFTKNMLVNFENFKPSTGDLGLKKKRGKIRRVKKNISDRTCEYW